MRINMSCFCYALLIRFNIINLFLSQINRAIIVQKKKKKKENPKTPTGILWNLKSNLKILLKI